MSGNRPALHFTPEQLERQRMMKQRFQSSIVPGSQTTRKTYKEELLSSAAELRKQGYPEMLKVAEIMERRALTAPPRPRT